MGGYFCIGFKSFLDYNNLFSSDKYEKNHKLILKYSE